MRTIPIWLRPLLARSLLALALIAAAGHLTAQPAHACSGPPTRFDILLENATHLVKVRLVESDTAGQNYIVQVEQYITGGPGPEFMLISQNPVQIVQGILDGRMGGGDCNYMALSPPPDKPFYVFVKHHLTGYYEGLGGIFSLEFYTFPTPDAVNPVYLPKPGLEDDPYDYEDVEVTEDGFLALAREYSGDDPVPPYDDRPYPLKAPLLLTSDQGSPYLLPIDGDPPVLLDQETLILLLARSDTHYLLFRNTDDCRADKPECALELLPGGTVRQVTHGQPDFLLSVYGVPTAPGDDALSSPVGPMAIWQGDTLAIYTPHNDTSARQWFEDREEISGQFTLVDGLDVRSATQAAWSHDGRLLAFSDGRGLWLWDVFTEDAAPRLLLPADRGVIPTARAFAPTDRYLAITRGETRETLDLVSGSTLPDGVVSPDGRYMLAFGDLMEEDPSGSGPELRMLYLNRLSPPGNMHEREYARQAAWIDPDHFVVTLCPPPGLDNCFVWHGEEFANLHRYDSFYRPEDVEPGTEFALSSNGELAVLVDDSTLSIERRLVPVALDGAIAEMRWLPSLFWGVD